MDDKALGSGRQPVYSRNICKVVSQRMCPIGQTWDETRLDADSDWPAEDWQDNDAIYSVQESQFDPLWGAE